MTMENALRGERLAGPDGVVGCVGGLRLRMPCVSRRACSAQDDNRLKAGKMPTLLSSPADSVSCVLYDDAGGGQFGAQRVGSFKVASFSRRFHFSEFLVDLFVCELGGSGKLPYLGTDFLFA